MLLVPGMADLDSDFLGYIPQITCSFHYNEAQWIFIYIVILIASSV